MKAARQQFIRQCGHSLPVFDRPVRFMDIGCGDGALTAPLLTRLVDAGNVPGAREVLLVELSPAMAALAEETVRDALPGVDIAVRNSRMEDCPPSIDSHFEIAMSSLACHHRPIERKRVHLSRPKPWIDHLVPFEMDAAQQHSRRLHPGPCPLCLPVLQPHHRIHPHPRRTGASCH